MSIISELYEQEIYERNQNLKKRMEEYISFLEAKKTAYVTNLGDRGNSIIVQAIEEFKRIFKNELR